MASIIGTLVDRYKKRKKFKKDTRAEAQDIFKKIETGGKRYWNPKNESRKDNISYKRILNQVRDVRKNSPRKEQ